MIRLQQWCHYCAIWLENQESEQLFWEDVKVIMALLKEEEDELRQGLFDTKQYFRSFPYKSRKTKLVFEVPLFVFQYTRILKGKITKTFSFSANYNRIIHIVDLYKDGCHNDQMQL